MGGSESVMRRLLLVLLLAQGATSIDAQLEDLWRDKSVTSASRSTDGEFLRRVTLDLTGTIPTEDELTAFLKKPDRAAKIDELLALPRCNAFLAECFSLSLYGFDDKFDTQRGPLTVWLRGQFEKSEPYDRIVTRLLTASGGNDANPPANWVGRFLPNNQPEEIAVKVSRTFLGVRLGCARCHDHPFDKWTQEDFYSFAAFFKATTRGYVANGRVTIDDDLGRAKAAYKPAMLKKAAPPRFLNGAEPQTMALRDEFALFLTSNRQFARAIANRLWYHCFGRGIVHPIDNFSGKNPAVAPKLLEFLADEIIRLKFDVKAFLRLITNSKTYQLTSTGGDPVRERLFAVAAVRPLTAAQSVSALDRALQLDAALGRDEAAKVRDRIGRYFMRNAAEEDLTNLFEFRETIGDVMLRMTFDSQRITGKGVFAQKLDVDRVYRILLCRAPSAKEKAACEAFLKKATIDELFMTLLNSHEFSFNH